MTPLPRMRAVSNEKSKIQIFNIGSQIFKTGNNWFSLDTTTSPYQKRPKTPLYKQSSDYLHSKDELKAFALPVVYDLFDKEVMESFNENDDIDRRREAHHRLSQVESDDKLLKEEWQQLEEDELSFKQLVTTYNQFILANIYKRTTSQKKVEFSRRRRYQLRDQISNLKVKNRTLKEVTTRMNEMCVQHEIYHVFCAEAAESGDYGSSIDLILRYSILKEAEDILMKKRDDLMKTVLDRLSELKKMHQYRSDLVRSLTIRINEQKEQYEAVVAKVTRCHCFLNFVQDKCLVLSKEFFEGLQSVSTIYKIVNSRKVEQQRVSLENVDEQLQYIKRHIGILKGRSGSKTAVEKKGKRLIHEAIPNLVQEMNIENMRREQEKSGKVILDENESDSTIISDELSRRFNVSENIGKKQSLVLPVRKPSRKSIEEDVEMGPQKRRATFRRSLASIRALSLAEPEEILNPLEHNILLEENRNQAKMRDKFRWSEIRLPLLKHSAWDDALVTEIHKAKKASNVPSDFSLRRPSIHSISRRPSVVGKGSHMSFGVMKTKKEGNKKKPQKAAHLHDDHEMSITSSKDSSKMSLETMNVKQPSYSEDTDVDTNTVTVEEDLLQVQNIKKT